MRDADAGVLDASFRWPCLRFSLQIRGSGGPGCGVGSGRVRAVRPAGSGCPGCGGRLRVRCRRRVRSGPGVAAARQAVAGAREPGAGSLEHGRGHTPTGTHGRWRKPDRSRLRTGLQAPVRAPPRAARRGCPATLPCTATARGRPSVAADGRRRGRAASARRRTAARRRRWPPRKPPRRGRRGSREGRPAASVDRAVRPCGLAGRALALSVALLEPERAGAGVRDPDVDLVEAVEIGSSTGSRGLASGSSIPRARTRARSPSVKSSRNGGNARQLHLALPPLAVSRSSSSPSTIGGSANCATTTRTSTPPTAKVASRRIMSASSRRGGRVAEGTRLLSEYGVHAPSRVRIPPSPLLRGRLTGV